MSKMQRNSVQISRKKRKDSFLFTFVCFKPEEPTKNCNLSSTLVFLAMAVLKGVRAYLKISETLILAFLAYKLDGNWDFNSGPHTC
jgi:hypothetical protein